MRSTRGLRDRQPIRLTPDQEAQFWANVPASFDGDNGVCWPWEGFRFPDGYGGFLGHPAHRVAYVLWNNGDQPGRLLVRHSCHNKPCCNPHHLSIGTHQDNMDDMVRAGRQNNGTAVTERVLTMEDADVIRVSSKTAAQLAKQYGVKKSAIYCIWGGRTWRK